jgi:fructokinase
VLLRPAPLHRDVPVGTRPRRRPRAPRRSGHGADPASAARDGVARRAGDAPLERRRSRRSPRRRPAAQATLARYADRLARALASVVNVLDPDIVVLGGGLSNIDALDAEVAARLPQHVFSDRCTTPVVRNRHGDSSGVRGAAWLWPAA